MRHRFYVAEVTALVLLLLGPVGCGMRTDVIERTPLSTSLRSYRSVSLELVYTVAMDEDELADFEEQLEQRLEESGIFREIVSYGLPADALIRASLISRSEDGAVVLTFAVEIFDNRQRQLVGRFDVIANSQQVGGGGAIDINLDTKDERALYKAGRAIANHLEELAGDG